MPLALIVGAGIGGLSAAIALRRVGWDVRIFERTASPRELGFGLLLSPNAIAALRRLNVADDVLARGFTPTEGEVRRMDGTVLRRARLPPPEVLGGPTIVAMRVALHGALVDAVGLDAITLSSEVTGFTETGRGVTARAETGDVAGDLLVGADGIGSVVRRVLHPTEAAPRSSGVVAVRGAAYGAVHHLGDLSGVYYLGPGVESFLARASETSIYWALSLARDLVPPGICDPVGILTEMSPRFDATFRAVTAGTEELRCDELVDRDPLPFWSRGVVTLLGDAAHPVLPHTGQGAAQAIVDGVTLGQAVSRGAGVEEALKWYEDERRLKTAALVAQGRRTARVMRSQGLLVNWLRDTAVRLVPIEPMFRVFARINRKAGTDVSG